MHKALHHRPNCGRGAAFVPTMFIEVPKTVMAQAGIRAERIPEMYFSDNVLLRKFFWLRLRFLCRAIARWAKRGDTCLDFGGGSGAFLPTLCAYFERVTCIDLEIGPALAVQGHYGLGNADIHCADLRSAALKNAPFGTIVAADVLEHFRDLRPAVAAIRAGLRDDGILFTSLPTENAAYLALRRLFGVTKPPDHYHSADDVEFYLAENGFVRWETRCVPLIVPVLPLYLVSVWKKFSQP